MPDASPRRTLREIAVIIFTHWLAILAVTVIVTGATVVACVVSKKVYRSKVTLWPKLTRPADPLAEKRDPMSQLEVFLKTQRQIILSEPVIRKTLVELEKTRDIAGKDIEQFKNGIKITTPGGEDISKSEVFTISVDRAGTPKDAQTAAKTLTDVYLKQYRELRTQQETRSRTLLTDQLKDLKAKTLEPAQQAFNEFIKNKVKGNLLELTQLAKANTEVYHQQLRTAFEREAIKLNAEIGQYKALKQQVLAQIPTKLIQEGIDNVPPEKLQQLSIVVPDAVFKRNPIIDKLKKKLADLIITRNTLKEQYEDDFKLLRQNAGEIAAATREIIRELQAELKAIDQHIATLEARKDEIETRVKDENDAVDALSALFVEYQSRLQDVALARALYEKRRADLLDQDTAQRMAEKQVLVTVIEEATLPDPSQPVRPILWLYSVVALIVGLLLGTSFAFLAESYDHTIERIDDAERYFGIRVLASIPDTRGGLIK